MDLKKNVKTYLYVKNSQLFEKILFFRLQCKKVLKIEYLTLKMCVLRVFRHFDFQFYIFLEKLRLFYIRHVIFKLGFARVHNDFSQSTEESVVKVLK